MPKPVVTWDLSDLYKGIHDPRIEADIKDIEGDVVAFEATYRGKINEQMSAAAFKAVAGQYAAIIQRIRKLEVFASLEHSTHVDVEAYGAFFQHISTKTADLQAGLIFFETSLVTLSDATLQTFMADAELGLYHHYLQKKRIQKKHYLSEEAEKILQQKSLTGRQALVRLYTQKLVGQRELFALPGEKAKLVSIDYLSHLLYDKRRAVRKKAAQALGTIASRAAGDTVFIYNTLMQDVAGDAKLRTFDMPQDMRHMENELQRPAVEALVTAASDNYDLVQKYYRFKKQVMGVDELHDYDKYAPVFSDTKVHSLKDAQIIIDEAFAGFSPTFADIAKMFFEKRWIDATPRDHKQGGAYCAYATPDIHPYVLVNYHGSLRDVSILAHELGHGIQAYMARQQNILEYDWPLPIAETASVFAEMIVFNKLVEKETNRDKKLGLYMWKIESIFATLFRQISMYRFELAAHDLRQQEGELGAAKLHALWEKEQRAMFGKGMTMSAGNEAYWGLVPHFFHTPFYVYAYAFGQLLTLSLFAIYQQDPENFVKKYELFMATSGKQSPQELVRIFGVDIEDPAFWEQGIGEIRDLFTEAKKLAR